MPTPTYTPLATVTLGSSASSVTFSSIPATYRDLILVASGTATSNGALFLRYNGDTGANYSRVIMVGDGSTASSGSNTSQTFTGLVLWQTTQGNLLVNVQDYSATDKHKTGINRGDVAAAETFAGAHRWANNDAVTSITIFHGTAQMAVGTTLDLYGVIA
jgi:hypothetical protein